MESRIILATALAVLTLTGTSFASRTFSNNGTLAGWDYLVNRQLGTIQEVTDIVYKGPTALKFTQTFNLNVEKWYTSEGILNQGYHRGEAKFYGFAFRLSKTWNFTGTQPYTIAKFGTPAPEWPNIPAGQDCPSTWYPTSMVWVQGNQLYSNVHVGDLCDASGKTIFGNLAAISPGVWHTAVLYADWQSDDTGSYKIWFDGVAVLDKKNMTTTKTTDAGFEFHAGLDCNGWFDGNWDESGQDFKQIWIDNVAIATDFAGANPE